MRPMRPMPTVDVHAHLSPSAGAARLTLGERLAHMDRVGTDVQLVSVAAPLLDQDLGPAEARLANREIAAMVSERPDRLTGLAVLPLREVGAAVDELHHAVADLGLKGAEVATHVRGRSWDEPEYAPIFEAAERLGAVLFFHSTSSVVPTRNDWHPLEDMVGMPLEDTLAVATLICSGVLERHPGLKVIVAHGGGPACYDIGRIDRGWLVRREARSGINRPPSQYLDRLHFDSLTWSERALRLLIDTVGADRVVMGSGWPGEMGLDAPVAWLDSLPSISDAERRLIQGANAARLLSLAGADAPT
jgi:aminocarboxymuconate-semialdehyde decarboxylase